MKTKLFFSALALSSLLLTSPSYAKTINLYDQPKTDGKVIGSVDSNVGIIPIFSPKENTGWVKVADPRNGNVGWIKSNEFSDAKGSSFSFKVISTGSGDNSYQIVQFGAPSNISSEKTEAMFKQMQIKQQQLQKDMQKMATDLFKDAEKTWANFPVFVPVFIGPETQKQKPQQPSETKK